LLDWRLRRPCANERVACANERVACANERVARGNERSAFPREFRSVAYNRESRRHKRVPVSYQRANFFSKDTDRRYW